MKGSGVAVLMQIGAKIQRLRKKYGLTQEDLADRAELSLSLIHI